MLKSDLVPQEAITAFFKICREYPQNIVVFCDSRSWKSMRFRPSVVCDQICLPTYRNGTFNSHYIRIYYNNFYNIFLLFKYVLQDSSVFQQHCKTYCVPPNLNTERSTVYCRTAVFSGSLIIACFSNSGITNIHCGYFTSFYRITGVSFWSVVYHLKKHCYIIRQRRKDRVGLNIYRGGQIGQRISKAFRRKNKVTQTSLSREGQRQRKESKLILE